MGFSLSGRENTAFGYAQCKTFGEDLEDTIFPPNQLRGEVLLAINDGHLNMRDVS